MDDAAAGQRLLDAGNTCVFQDLLGLGWLGATRDERCDEQNPTCRLPEPCHGATKRHVIVEGMEQRSREQGFTIVEVMVVVAIIGVLAAVVIPNFMQQSKKSKAKSEVGAMFAELGVREEQYKLENGSYLEAAACPSGTPSSTPRAVTACLATATPWDKLRVRPPSASSATTTTPATYCTYQVTTNLSASTTPPTGFHVHGACELLVLHGRDL